MPNHRPPNKPHRNTFRLETSDHTKPWQPNGRFGRLQYLAWNMILTLVSFAIFAVAIGIEPAIDLLVYGYDSINHIPSTPQILLLSIGGGLLLILGLFFTIRRLHDFNKSGHWLWNLLFIILGAIAAAFVQIIFESSIGWHLFDAALICLLLYISLMPGTKGNNNYGAPRRLQPWETVFGYIFAAYYVITEIIRRI